MKYPYIGKWEYINTTVIFTDENAGIEIGGEMSFRDDWTEINYKNITTEYLANTYGEVESKEHAEFIVKLAKTNGLIVYEASYPIKRDYFAFSKHGKLFFFSEESQANFNKRKKITIPLPPTDTNTNTPEEDFEMQQIEKNNGDNLIFSGDNKCKEWPQVGDKVTWGNRLVTGEVKALSDGLAWVKSYHGNYRTERVELLEKPKTIEEELRDGILDCDNFDITEDKAAQIANWLTQKGYNITKKPQ